MLRLLEPAVTYGTLSQHHDEARGIASANEEGYESQSIRHCQRSRPEQEKEANNCGSKRKQQKGSREEEKKVRGKLQIRGGGQVTL